MAKVQGQGLLQVVLLAMALVLLGLAVLVQQRVVNRRERKQALVQQRVEALERQVLELESALVLAKARLAVVQLAPRHQAKG